MEQEWVGFILKRLWVHQRISFVCFSLKTDDESGKILMKSFLMKHCNALELQTPNVEFWKWKHVEVERFIPIKSFLNSDEALKLQTPNVDAL